MSLEAHRDLHRLKPEKKDLNPSPFDQEGRPLNQMIAVLLFLKELTFFPSSTFKVFSTRWKEMETFSLMKEFLLKKINATMNFIQC